MGSGTRGEDIAVDYLNRKGYRILTRNFRFGRGEIDIIAEDQDVLVFIEVKSRSSDAYGEPEDSITIRKRKQLRKVALGYLFVHAIEGKPCRFDVVAISFEGGSYTLRHIENAF